MKVKFFPIFLIIIFVIIFLIFYKGLQNSNIYTPNTLIKKNIPSFEAKTLRTNKKIDKKHIHNFINSLSVSESIKIELKDITPENFTGIH